MRFFLKRVAFYGGYLAAAAFLFAFTSLPPAVKAGLLDAAVAGVPVGVIVVPLFGLPAVRRYFARAEKPNDSQRAAKYIPGLALVGVGLLLLSWFAAIDWAATLAAVAAFACFEIHVERDRQHRAADSDAGGPPAPARSRH
jgi:hypothetical protein